MRLWWCVLISCGCRGVGARRKSVGALLIPRRWRRTPGSGACRPPVWPHGRRVSPIAPTIVRAAAAATDVAASPAADLTARIAVDRGGGRRRLLASVFIFGVTLAAELRLHATAAGCRRARQLAATVVPWRFRWGTRYAVGLASGLVAVLGRRGR